MTELSALAGSEGYAACDDEAKDMQLATTKRRICSLRRRSEGYAACDDDGSVFSHVVSGVALVAVAAEGLAVYEVGIRLGKLLAALGAGAVGEHARALG